MACSCMTWGRTYPITGEEHHHRECGYYLTDRVPRLFVYVPAEECWVPVPKHITSLLEPPEDYESGQNIALLFRRMDITDHDYREIMTSDKIVYVDQEVSNDD